MSPTGGKKSKIRPEDVPDLDAAKILEFLNAAETAEEIAEAVEIPDERDVGIGVAQNILDRRQKLGNFDDLAQVADVPQVGPERFTEIVTSLRRVYPPVDPRKMLRDVPRNVQRRILNIYNRARSPKELAKLPIAEMRPNDPDLLIKRRDDRGILGFLHVRELLGLPGFNLGRIRTLLDLMGPATHGAWATDPLPLNDPDGDSFGPIHAALLKNGRVLFIGHHGGESGTIVWDPSDGSTAYPNPQTTENMYCCGHSFLEDGTLLTVGGGGAGPGGEPDNGWLFEPDVGANGGWRETQNGAVGGKVFQKRWYPTAVTISNKEVLVVSGRYYDSSATPCEIYNHSTESFSMVVVDNDRLFPQTYPGLHLLPGREVFYSRTGFGTSSGTAASPHLDPDPTAALFRQSGVSPTGWTSVDAPEYTDRTKGMSVPIYRKCAPNGWSVDILVAGGNDGGALTTAERIDTSAATPIWGTPMPLGTLQRRNVNLVLLPDGTVFLCGGVNAPDTECLLYDPEAPGTVWSSMDDLPSERDYHSVALLLPDGRVVVGDMYHNGLEVFSPPYLFQGGTRPDIATLPAVGHHGQTITVTLADPVTVDKVTLVRPIAVTHQTDSEQRVIPLDFTANGTKVTVTMPNGNHPHPVAPRGHYLLFVIDDQGVPSVGRFLQLH